MWRKWRGVSGCCCQPHELFPDATPEQHRLIDGLFLDRLSNLPGHARESSPYKYAREDLRTWAEVAARFGGGAYRSVGLDKHGQIVCWSPSKEKAPMVVAPDVPSLPFYRAESGAPEGSDEQALSVPPLSPVDELRLLAAMYAVLKRRSDPQRDRLLN